MDLLNTEAEDFLCDESFQRYCRGESIADVIVWEKWIDEHPEKQPEIVEAMRLFDLLTAGQGNRLEQLAALKDAIERQMKFKKEVLGQRADMEKPVGIESGKGIVPQAGKPVSVESDESAVPRAGKWVGMKLWGRVAASIIVLGGLGALGYGRYWKKVTGGLYAYEYRTGAHGHKTIMLPDSSIVMLNENSDLVISKDFDPQHRQVAITGEAFFDIKHDAGHPFLVDTRQYQIRVLGTSFNVRSYPGKGETETTLLTGHIEIVQHGGEERKEAVVLKPNQKFVFKPETGTRKVMIPNLDTATHRLAETSWARRKMEISDKTLGEIAEELQSWYGIKIRFADATVKSYRYTATFDDETIFNILQYLQQSYPFAYSIKDDCIVIASN